MIPNKTLNQKRTTSILAAELKGSEIIKLAGEIRDKISEGAEIFNYTIGDFDPEIFPIPEGFEKEIREAYRHKQTNYPAANGMLELRKTLSSYIERKQGLGYQSTEFLVAGGARPLIYAAYQAILDPEEPAIFPVPSWNNNHYTTLTRGKQICIETLPENNFMPTAGRNCPAHFRSGDYSFMLTIEPYWHCIF